MKGIKKNTLFLLLTAVSFVLLIIGFSTISYAQSPNQMLKMVFIEAKSPAEVKKMARMGIDIASVREGPIVKDARDIPAQTYRIEAAVSIRDEKKLRYEGINWSDAAIKTHAMYGASTPSFRALTIR